MAVRDHSDLRVYRLAYRAAMELFGESKAWPKEERYALTDQVRRSSRAVCANLAEAWGKRRYPKHFVSKLTDAEAEAAETMTWIRFAMDCGYLDPQSAERLLRDYDQLRGGLIKMATSPDPWCGPATLAKEPEIGYFA